MAGAGYRDWTAGEKPTAAQFDTYLQEQTCMVFASAAARNSALAAVLAEGMLAYLLDTNTMTVYSGSAWSTIGPVHGALTSWTPTVTQSGSVTISITEAFTSRLGRLVFLTARFAPTGTGTAGTDIILGGLPYAASGSTDGTQAIGWGTILDGSASQEYEGSLRLVSSTSVKIRADSLTSGAFLGGTGFTAGLNNQDRLSLYAVYTAAADA